MARDYSKLVEAVEKATLEGPADTPPALRAAAAERAAGGGAAADGPYDGLARQIGEASYRVTDAQIAALRSAAGSERAAFEIVAAAALGAGLKRWRAGIAVLEEATRAAS
jgi:hypothetical protein